MAHTASVLARMRGRAAGGEPPQGCWPRAQPSGRRRSHGQAGPTQKQARLARAFPRAGGRRARPGLLLRPLRGNASGGGGGGASRARLLSAHDSPSTAHPGRLRSLLRAQAPGREDEGGHTNTPPFGPGRKMAAPAAPGRRRLRGRQAPPEPSLFLQSPPLRPPAHPA